jgi:hypothetical protein
MTRADDLLATHPVYAYLRQIREKTGCRRMAELIRNLNDMQVPLRRDERR